MKLEDDHQNQEEEDLKNKTNIRLIIHVICIVGFLCCTVWLIWYLFSIFRSNYLLEDLKENFVTELTPSTIFVQPTEQPTDAPAAPTPEPNLFGDRAYPDFERLDVPRLELDFDGLQEVNPDVYAWIYVPDTAINYPITQRAGDADYYLLRDLQGNSNAYGTIFTQYYNHKDWLDNLTVIYGHNMRDGSMFAALHYFEDSKFFDEHPYIYIYTPEYTLAYKIFAAHEYPDVHLLLSYTMNDRGTFEQYLEQVLSLDGLRDNINRDIEISGDDHVIALSTCMGSGRTEYRYIVQAKLTAVEKTAYAVEAADNEGLSEKADAGE